ncbi:hypothetical protein TH30_02280 [Thalassospira profundimaris]|uniref:Uncharacterized protein n=1 Tax=Thalassospira profundimaris TaxID=502049 RepID=A0A367X671_9PROT|nr:hypothetical protein TH30_02280 [Thalassospira profundimaris]
MTSRNPNIEMIRRSILLVALKGAIATIALSTLTIFGDFPSGIHLPILAVGLQLGLTASIGYFACQWQHKPKQKSSHYASDLIANLCAVWCVFIAFGIIIHSAEVASAIKSLN